MSTGNFTNGHGRRLLFLLHRAALFLLDDAAAFLFEAVSASRLACRLGDGNPALFRHLLVTLGAACHSK